LQRPQFALVVNFCAVKVESCRSHSPPARLLQWLHRQPHPHCAQHCRQCIHLWVALCRQYALQGFSVQLRRFGRDKPDV